MRASVLEVYQAPSPYPLPRLIVGEGIQAAPPVDGGGEQSRTKLAPQGGFGPQRLLHLVIGRPPIGALDLGDPVLYKPGGRLDLVQAARIIDQAVGLLR